MTNEELKSKLDEFGVDYDPKATKAELEALLEDAKQPLAASAGVSTDSKSTGEIDVANARIAELEAQLKEATERPSESLQPMPTESQVRVILTDPNATDLNVRDTPDGSLITTVPNGEVLQAAGMPIDGWQPITLTVWVKADLVESIDE